MDYKLFMQETPKPEQDEGKELKDVPANADQKNRPYYYDDWYGYEAYIPGDDDDVPESRPGDQLKDRRDTSAPHKS